MSRANEDNAALPCQCASVAVPASKCRPERRQRGTNREVILIRYTKTRTEPLDSYGDDTDCLYCTLYARAHFPVQNARLARRNWNVLQNSPILTMNAATRFFP